MSDFWSLKDKARISSFQSKVDSIRIEYASLLHDKKEKKNQSKNNSNITIVYLTGWKETFYKYDELFRELHYHRGFNIFAMDHRSQGASDDHPGTKVKRGHADGSGRRVCYVDNFETSYVADVKQFLQEIVRPAVLTDDDGSVCLMGRSMGGTIVTRLAQIGCNASSDTDTDNQDGGDNTKGTDLFDRVIALEPMFLHKNILSIGGLFDVELPLSIGVAVASLLVKLGLGKELADGRDTDASKPTTELLTHDSKRNEEWNALRRAHPEFVLAGASFGWVHAANRIEHRVMKDVHRIHVPVLIFQPDDDSFVYSSAHDDFAKQKQDFVRVVGPIRNSYHEILQEVDEIRTPVINVICAFASLGKNVDPPFPKEVLDVIDSVPIQRDRGSSGDDHRCDSCRWPKGYHSGLRPPSTPVPLILKDKPGVRRFINVFVGGTAVALIAAYAIRVFQKK